MQKINNTGQASGGCVCVGGGASFLNNPLYTMTGDSGAVKKEEIFNGGSLSKWVQTGMGGNYIV